MLTRCVENDRCWNRSCKPCIPCIPCIKLQDTNGDTPEFLFYCSKNWRLQQVRRLSKYSSNVWAMSFSSLTIDFIILRSAGMLTWHSLLWKPSFSCLGSRQLYLCLLADMGVSGPAALPFIGCLFLSVQGSFKCAGVSFLFVAQRLSHRKIYNWWNLAGKKLHSLFTVVPHISKEAVPFL